MLELKGIHKTYVPIKGKPVFALKDIHLNFNSTGLVFILGKSGSGKSTLLNLIGGLDCPDQGEMSFLNHSIDHMSKTSYDAYRNSVIGFIFQDFNLIESFSVYKNIALASELQGIKPDDTTIRSLLNRLELSNEIDRMPYELSGGQKQRISIARALIKNPKIILADEPTGSLDLETGKQIFSVLKSLSKEKLVIVVSHDKEYANTYADRIIELSDGVIIKDSAPVQASINPQDIFELKAPKMSAKNAFSLGLSAMMRKPLKLISTLCLLTFAFMLYGIFDASSNYDINEVALRASYHQHQHVLTLSKQKYDEINQYYTFIPFNIMQFNQLKEDYPNYHMKPVYQYQLDMNSVYNPQNTYGYYGNRFTGVVVMDESFLEEASFNLIGSIPSEPNEVMISLYMAESYLAFGYDQGNKLEINEVQELIGKKINHDNDLVISGIIDTKFNQERYSKVKHIGASYQNNRMLDLELRMIQTGSIHTYLYVHPTFMTEVQTLNSISNTINSSHSSIALYAGTKGNQSDMNDSIHTIYNQRIIRKTESIPENTVFIHGFQGTKLTGNQVLLSMDNIETYTAEAYQNTFDVLVLARRDGLIDEFAEGHFESISHHYLESTTIQSWQDYANYIKTYQLVPHATIFFDFFESKARADVALDIYLGLNYYARLFVQRNLTELEYLSSRLDVEIVGFHPGYQTLVSPEFFDIVIEETGFHEYRQVMVILKNAIHEDLRFLNQMKQGNDTFGVYNEISFSMNYINDPILFFSSILVWIAAGIGIFSVVLFYNFMTVSISHKKKDIGILRALGARQKDVFYIFYSEAFLISIIVGLLSIGLSAIFIYFGNLLIVRQFGLNASLLWISIRQVLMILGLVMSVGVFSSFLPILKFSKEKPIDIIKVV